MRLLDLFSGAGGCSVGYHRAGFTDITGVDLHPMPRYPFKFVQADALEFLAGVKPGEYDLIHASPPSQGYSEAQKIQGNDHPLLIEPLRTALQRLGTPFVIENVEGAPLSSPVRLCGAMFPRLRTYRHRLFESSAPLVAPVHPLHLWGQAKMGRPPREDEFLHVVGNFSGARAGRAAMGIDWMTRDELREAIPPAYCEWIGRQMLSHINAEVRHA